MISALDSLPRPSTDWALFLDVDGTLVEIADHPDAAFATGDLAPILQSLASGLNGAVALVSGRSVEGIDKLVAVQDIAAAGLHGLQRRDASGAWRQKPQASPALETVRERLRGFADAWPGTYLEDKGAALALHYRKAPDAAEPAREITAQLASELGDEFKLILGKCVFEFRPHGMDKGKVVEQFLAEPPFARRTPVFIGDDVTDEDGFAAVNLHNGISIRVGEPEHGASQAQYKLNSVKETLQWLQQVAAALADPANKPT